VLEIVDWADTFERQGNAKHVGFMHWIALPTKHDGEGYTELITGERGPEDYAAWVLMAQVAAKCKPRGRLARRDGTPHTPRSLHLKTRAPERIFAHAIPGLCKIGWLKEIPEHQRNTGGQPAVLDTLHNKTVHNNTKDICAEPDKPAAAPEPAVLMLELIPRDGTFAITQSLIDEYKASFPGVDVLRELRRACQYVRDNPRKRKTKRGARRYLGGWLGRSQDGRGGRATGIILDDGAYKERSSAQQERFKREAAEAAKSMQTPREPGMNTKRRKALDGLEGKK
jgi:hypothetical protein